MPLVVPQVGEVVLLNKMIHDALSVDDNYILKLFSNDVTPSGVFTSSSLTQATFGGYTAMTLQRTSWNAPAIASGQAVSSYGSVPQTWTCHTTGQTVFGYWVESANSGTLLWAERFAVARILADSDVLNLTPQFALASQN